MEKINTQFQYFIKEHIYILHTYTITAYIYITTEFSINIYYLFLRYRSILCATYVDHRLSKQYLENILLLKIFVTANFIEYILVYKELLK